MEKDMFLYLMMVDGGCFRLCLTDMCKWSCPIYVEKRVQLPAGLSPITVNSQVFLVGQRSDVYYIDSVARGSDCPRICRPHPDDPVSSIAGLLNHRKFVGSPIIETLENKIYVLETPPKPHRGSETYGDGRLPELFFKVFDPSKNAWESLRYPPHLRCPDNWRYLKPYVSSHSAWGHKLLVGSSGLHGCLKMYDTRLEKWVHHRYRNLVAFAEVKGFFIAVEFPGRVIACRLDSNGMPGKEYMVLRELEQLFCPFLWLDKCFMGIYDRDHLWLVHTAMDTENDSYETHVAVFEVILSYDLAGSTIPFACLKASQSYHLAVRDSDDIDHSDRLSSAFAVLQHVNKDDGIWERELTIPPQHHHQHCYPQKLQDFEPLSSEAHSVKRWRSSSEDSEPHKRGHSSSEDSEPDKRGRSSSEDSEPHNVKRARQESSSEDSDSFDYQCMSPPEPPIKLSKEWVLSLSSVEDIYQKFKRFWLGKLRSSPWSGLFVLQSEWRIERTLLGRINAKGFLIINIQPAVNGQRTDSPSFGSGGLPGGYFYQRACVEFFCSKEKLDALVDKCKALPSLTYNAMKRDGSWISNKGREDVNLVTWEVFPEGTIERTVLNHDNFIVRKDEAFEIWPTWAGLYLECYSSRELLEKVQNGYFFVSLVDNDYIHGDLFAVFADF